MAGSKHNDPLEEFFKEKIDDADIPFNEADWEAMENRLDQTKKAALLSWQNKLTRYAVAAILLIIFSGLGFVIYQNYNHINALEAKLSQQQTNQYSGKILTNNRNVTDESKTNNTLKSNGNNIVNNQMSAAQNGQGKISKTPKSQNTGTRTRTNSAKSTSLDDKTPQSEAFGGTTHFLASGAKMVNTNEMAVIKATGQSISLSLSKQNLKSTEINLPVIDAAIANGHRIPASTEINNAIRSGYSGFSFGITAGPDFSTAGSLHNFYIPGYKIGAMTEYSLNKNFSISTGVIYSNVNYTADGSEYNAPKGFFGYSTVPEKAKAYCAILSIPIRVKFNFIHLTDSRFYMTAGVASYIMLNETYEFYYRQQDKSHSPQKWSEHTGTRHWLSNLTLSLGYEFDVSPTVSLRVEPYINIPVKKVGWGNVALYSTGTLISINYRFK